MTVLYGGRYLTAGNPYVAADGTSFPNLSPASDDYTNSIQNWNLALISGGQAVLGPDGVVSLDTLKSFLQQHGYVGPQDMTSLAQAYNLLKKPPPPTPGPAGSPTLTNNPLANLPSPVLIGGGVLLLLMLGGRKGIL